MNPLDILKQYWGYDQFRPLQEDIIRSVLDGKDSLALMPTGGGKSLCFQVPALSKAGICIVISPLIALMKDQVFHLKQKNIPAEAIFSGMRYQDIDRILDNCIYGDTKLLYVSPERLKTELLIERIKKMNVNLIAVDEAHCISQWGYDFRPAYLEIALIREVLPDVPVLALTATATSKVVEDIQIKLAFKKGVVFQKSFVRDNLAYVVLHENDKDKKMVEILEKVPGSGVIYVRSRRRTKDVATVLQHHGVSADFYHAGLTADDRSRKQEEWINNVKRIIVCTNAFGMGIDKPDVRSVIHMDVPDSPEAYFQEAGRAGRDGQKAYAVMLYQEEDGVALQHYFESSFPPIKHIKQVYQALGSYCQLATGAGAGQSFDFDIVDFCKKFNFEPTPVFSSLKILEQSGWLILSEAIYVPSALTIKVSKEKLYDYQLRNKELDMLIKAILRTAEGAFHHFVSINENQLALFLKMDYSVLIANLHRLHKEGIITYVAKKDAPQIIFLQERVELANLSIDQKLYDFRKQRQQERVRKMIAYAEDLVCRQRQLLEYFGENKSEDCGICDVCLDRNKTLVSREEHLHLSGRIEQLLQEKSQSVGELLQSFSPRRRKQVMTVLDLLTEEGFVSNVNELLEWNKK